VRHLGEVAEERGVVLAIDYGGDTAELIARPEHGWLRTYRAHGRGGDPLAQPGSADITIDVPFDQLNRVRRPSANRTQAEFLRANGIEELVAEARAVWTERASIGDFAALKARSFVNEADALLDESGLGAFRVVEWHVR
jgi:SAM-dependent MidA family methyltransferase